MNQRIFSGLIILGGVALLAAVLIISIPAPHSTIPSSSQPINLMTEHMKLHQMLDKNMDAQADMIGRIITMLEQIMKVKEKR